VTPGVRTRWLLGGVLLVIVAVNLVQFPRIDAARGNVGYAALGRTSTSDILVLSTENEQTELQYDLYRGLAASSPGAEILISAEGSFPAREFREFAESFGRSASVRLVAFDDDASDLPIDALLAAGGVIAADGVAKMSDRPRVAWRLVTAECGVAAGPTPGRKLVVVRWDEAGDVVLGLVEACLLPDGFAGGGS
jgi:hypothetical protein